MLYAVDFSNDANIRAQTSPGEWPRAWTIHATTYRSDLAFRKSQAVFAGPGAWPPP
jgi:hypothetical protein